VFSLKKSIKGAIRGNFCWIVAETMRRLNKAQGRSGVAVPAGIESECASRSYAAEVSSGEGRQKSSQNFRVLNITEYWVKADYKASLKDGAAKLMQKALAVIRGDNGRTT
jgi:hypothetical protein